MPRVTKLDDQELIDIALSSDGPFKDEPSDEIALFIRYIDIQPGDIEVDNGVIYNAYCRWSENDKKRMSRISFFKRFAKWFRPQQKSSKRFYYLNKTAFEITKTFTTDLGENSEEENKA